MAEDPTKEQRQEWHKLLDGVAEDAIKFHLHQPKAAAKAMTERVRSDPRLSKAMLELLVFEACSDRIRRILQIANQATWQNHESFDATHRGGRLRSALRAARKLKLMEYTLRGGIPLGLATRKQVLENAEFQEKQAIRMFQTALWLGLVADQMKDDTQLVRDVLNEDELRRLQTLAIKSGSPVKTSPENAS